MWAARKRVEGRGRGRAIQSWRPMQWSNAIREAANERRAHVAVREESRRLGNAHGLRPWVCVCVCANPGRLRIGIMSRHLTPLILTLPSTLCMHIVCLCQHKHTQLPAIAPAPTRTKTCFLPLGPRRARQRVPPAANGRLPLRNASSLLYTAARDSGRQPPSSRWAGRWPQADRHGCMQT